MEDIKKTIAGVVIGAGLMVGGSAIVNNVDNSHCNTYDKDTQIIFKVKTDYGEFTDALYVPISCPQISEIIQERVYNFENSIKNPVVDEKIDNELTKENNIIDNNNDEI